MADRVIVFMDYQNVHGWAQRQFFAPGCDNADGHVNPLKVGEHLVARRKRESELTQVRIYRGRPNPQHQPDAARANDRQTAFWESHPKVAVTRRNLRYPSDWPSTPPQEKGIDVAIAVDMINLAMRGEMDVAILFSSDTDLLPALEVLYDQRLCHVEVTAWEQAKRLRFAGQQLPWCHNINAEDYEALRDRANYSLRPQHFPAILRPKPRA